MLRTLDDVELHPNLPPTAVALPHAEPQTPAWYAQRREGITATDVPKILGASKYGNALTVWKDKRGELPAEEVGEAAHWGHVLEDPVAQRYAAETGYRVERIGVVHHAGAPWMRCSLDRLVFDGDQLVGALEVKTRSAFTAGAWSADVPDDVLAQVQWQLQVTGLPWIDVAVLLGGQRMVVHRLVLDEQIAGLALTEATAVWKHFLDGTVPYVRPDETLLDLLAKAYPNREGQRALDADQAELARSWIEARAQAKAREKQARADVKTAEGALVQLLGDGDLAAADGDVVFSYPRRERAGYTVEPTSYRQLVIPRPDRKA